MAEDKRIVNNRKPRPKYNPNNKEQASKNKKKRWKNHKKSKQVDMGTRLQELQAYINSEYHTD